ncbi:MAG: LVIVD repeat-containing protein, partial [Candidatus Thorarchaeota archaeon]
MMARKIGFALLILILSTVLLLNQPYFATAREEIHVDQITEYSGETYGITYGIFVEGDYAYVATSSGLEISDVSDPTDPKASVLEETAYFAQDVVVVGDYAYVTQLGGGVAIIDITDPTNPSAPVYRYTTGTSHDICVDGNYAYIADGPSGLAIIDISDPTNPIEVGQIDNGNAYNVYVSG